MHVPTLGSYPLVLRDYDVSSARDGELLLNYSTDDLYYINRSNHKRVRVADDIYRRILESKVQNNKLIIYDYDKKSEGGSLDPVSNNTLNLEYGEIKKGVAVIPENKNDSYVEKTTLVLDMSSYVWPPINEREYNAFYMVVKKRQTAKSKYRSTILDLASTTDSYIINDSGELDVNGHILVIAPSDIATYSFGKLNLDIILDEDEEESVEL